MSIRHATGPSTNQVPRAKAIAELRKHLPKDADFDIWEDRGHWVAAWTEKPNWKKSDFPVADADEESPAPKSEGPGDTGPPPPDKDTEKSDDGGGDDGGPPTDGGEGGPPHADKGKDGKGGESHLLHELLGIVTMMAEALGIEPPTGAGEGPVPGPEGPGGEGPPGGPPGPPGPPHGGPEGPPMHGGPGGPGGHNQTVEHTRALKPGEAPPGATPIGAPSFASVLPDNHPWKDVVGKVATFTVESNPIAKDARLEPINSELERVAYGTGYRVAQITKAVNESGDYVARALITSH